MAQTPPAIDHPEEGCPYDLNLSADEDASMQWLFSLMGEVAKRGGRSSGHAIQVMKTVRRMHSHTEHCHAIIHGVLRDCRDLIELMDKCAQRSHLFTGKGEA